MLWIAATTLLVFFVQVKGRAMDCRTELTTMGKCMNSELAKFPLPKFVEEDVFQAQIYECFEKSNCKCPFNFGKSDETEEESPDEFDKAVLKEITPYEGNGKSNLTQIGRICAERIRTEMEPETLECGRKLFGFDIFSMQKDIEKNNNATDQFRKFVDANRAAKRDQRRILIRQLASAVYNKSVCADDESRGHVRQCLSQVMDNAVEEAKGLNDFDKELLFSDTQRNMCNVHDNCKNKMSADCQQAHDAIPEVVCSCFADAMGTKVKRTLNALRMCYKEQLDKDEDINEFLPPYMLDDFVGNITQFAAQLACTIMSERSRSPCHVVVEETVAFQPDIFHVVIDSVSVESAAENGIETKAGLFSMAEATFNLAADNTFADGVKQIQEALANGKDDNLQHSINNIDQEKANDDEIEKLDRDIEEIENDDKQTENENKEIEEHKEIEKEDKEIEEEDKEIEKEDKEIEKEHKEIEEENKEIEEENKEIKEKNKEIEEKNQEIEEKNKEIEKEDKEIENKEETDKEDNTDDIEKEDIEKEDKEDNKDIEIEDNKDIEIENKEDNKDIEKEDQEDNKDIEIEDKEDNKDIEIENKEDNKDIENEDQENNKDIVIDDTEDKENIEKEDDEDNQDIEKEDNEDNQDIERENKEENDDDIEKEDTSKEDVDLDDEEDIEKIEIENKEDIKNRGNENEDKEDIKKEDKENVEKEIMDKEDIKKEDVDDKENMAEEEEKDNENEDNEKDDSDEDKEDSENEDNEKNDSDK